MLLLNAGSAASQQMQAAAAAPVAALSACRRLVPHWRTSVGFSEGYRQRPLGCANDEVVVKTIKADLRPRFGLTAAQEQERALLREGNVHLTLAALGLAHVVRIFAYTALDPSAPPPGGSSALVESCTYALVMEHCQLGSLGRLTGALAQRWAGASGWAAAATAMATAAPTRWVLMCACCGSGWHDTTEGSRLSKKLEEQ